MYTNYLIFHVDKKQASNFSALSKFLAKNT